jgi:hypothetical protein
MHRRAHRILMAWLLALYGTATLGGPALHALVGTDHGPARLASGEGGHADPTDRHDGAAHDCPICHFHAQGQLDVDPAEDRLIDVARIRPTDPHPLTFPPALDRPSGPRAPPLG